MPSLYSIGVHFFCRLRSYSSIAFTAAGLYLTAGCGNDTLRPTSSWDNQIMPFYYSFLSDAKRFKTPVSAGDDLIGLHFGSLQSPTIGECTLQDAQSTNLITRKTSTVGRWRDIVLQMPESGILDAKFKSVVYHELGHCLLNLNHVQDPNAIMNPVLSLSSEDIEDLWDTQVAAEFAQASDPLRTSPGGSGGSSGPTSLGFTGSNVLPLVSKPRM